MKHSNTKNLCKEIRRNEVKISSTIDSIADIRRDIDAMLAAGMSTLIQKYTGNTCF